MCFTSSFCNLITVDRRHDTDLDWYGGKHPFPFAASTIYGRDYFGTTPIDALDGVVRALKARDKCACLDNIRVKFLNPRYAGKSYKRFTKKIKRVGDLDAIIRRTPSLTRA